MFKQVENKKTEKSKREIEKKSNSSCIPFDLASTGQSTPATKGRLERTGENLEMTNDYRDLYPETKYMFISIKFHLT